MLVKYFMNIMTIYFNVLDSLIKDQIDNNLNSTCVINMKRSKSKLRNTKFT